MLTVSLRVCRGLVTVDACPALQLLVPIRYTEQGRGKRACANLALSLDKFAKF